MRLLSVLTFLAVALFGTLWARTAFAPAPGASVTVELPAARPLEPGPGFKFQ